MNPACPGRVVLGAADVGADRRSPLVVVARHEPTYLSMIFLSSSPHFAVGCVVRAAAATSSISASSALSSSMPQLVPSAMLRIWNSTGNQVPPVGQSEHQPAGRLAAC